MENLVMAIILSVEACGIIDLSFGCLYPAIKTLKMISIEVL